MEGETHKVLKKGLEIWRYRDQERERETERERERDSEREREREKKNCLLLYLTVSQMIEK